MGTVAGDVFRGAVNGAFAGTGNDQQAAMANRPPVKKVIRHGGQR